MATVLNPYLNFNGNAEEAFLLYKSVFGGELFVQRFKETSEAGQVPAEDQDKIMHISLKISEGHILMASDMLESMGHTHVLGNNFAISISVDSESEADRVFKELSVGGNVTMPLQKTFWGSYFGMLTDKFGIQWMMSYDAPKS